MTGKELSDRALLDREPFMSAEVYVKVGSRLYPVNNSFKSFNKNALIVVIDTGIIDLENQK